MLAGAQLNLVYTSAATVQALGSNSLDRVRSFSFLPFFMNVLLSLASIVRI